MGSKAGWRQQRKESVKWKNGLEISQSEQGEKNRKKNY